MRPRRAHRQDGNHHEICDEFTRLGAFVVDTSPLGDGRPDIFVGIDGVFMPIEIKDGARPPSKRSLSNDEIDWWMSARINPRVVKNLGEVADTVKVLQQWVEDIRKGRTDAKT